MVIRILAIFTLYFGATHSPHTQALTTQQFFDICESTKQSNCADVPVLQAYLGGALDLMATLDERTEYLGKFYCSDPKTLFDVSKIVAYMKDNKQDYLASNAMLLLIRYFEDEGKCNEDA